MVFRGVYRGVVFAPSLLLLLVAVVVVVVGGKEENVTRSRPSWKPRLLGSTPIKHAAFIEAYFSEDSSLDYLDRWSLYVSTFDPLGNTDEVYRVRAPGRHLDDPSALNVEEMDNTAFWPNNPDYLPSSVAGAEGVIWTSGFLVPGKGDGMLQMYKTGEDPMPPAVDIASLSTKTWSYHKVVWKDMDLDGDLDALTARFHQPLIGSTKKELLWLENEGQGFVEGWTQHVLANDGPDVSFATVTLSTAGREFDCIVVADFFGEKTSIYWTDDEQGSWADASQVRSRVINENAGQVFDVLVDDFNRDGVLEFLATEYRKDLGVGQATIYVFPDDFRTDPFTHFKIADSFRPNQIFGGQTMSPGSPKTYYPTQEFAAEMAEDGLPHKPYILLSGDDDGRMYVLFPNSDAREDWVYQKHILIDTEATTIGTEGTQEGTTEGKEDLPSHPKQKSSQ